MPSSTKPQIDEEILKQQIEEDKAKKETEEKRRKIVFNAIETLTDTVDEEKLLSLLDILDVNSWKEIVEERFIGRICGFPTCSNEIIVKRAQRYKLDKNKQKVYENYAEHEKFCSSICLQKSEHLQSQLAELPLWLMGERAAKDYDLIPSPSVSTTQPKTTTNGEKMLDERVEFIPDNLLVQLNSLNIGQIDASDSEGEDDENAVDASTLGSDDKQFLSNVRSFITAKAPSSNTNTSKTPENVAQKKSNIKKMDKETMESKLEKLRTKFGKLPKEQQKKAPIFVEPHHDIAPSKTKKDGGIVKAEEVMERLRLWITSNTIQYIDQASAVEPSTSSLETNTSTNEIPAQQFIEHFYSGILDPREYEKKKNKEEEAKTVKLPLVDSIDQHFRRVEIVVNGLKKAWISIVGQLKIAYPVNNTKNLISTFALNKDNCVIDPKNSDYFAAAILQMMTHCSNDLKELLGKEETTELYQKYYELLQIDFKYFDTKLSELINSKRQELAGQIKEEESNEMEH